MAVAVAGCAPLLPMHRAASADPKGRQSLAPPAPPQPLSPFDDSPVIFTVAGLHFTRGERVIVTVCLGPNHSIASADIFESSGDSKFDQLAVSWARRIRLREAAQGAQPVASCGAVRVEVRPAQEPRMFNVPADSLG